VKNQASSSRYNSIRLKSPSKKVVLTLTRLTNKKSGCIYSAATLSAITPAVVGVIVNPSLLFVYHVLWQQGFAGSVDVRAAGIALLAAIPLIRLKWNVKWVIALGTAAGLAIRFVGTIGR
jgi:hypothetical protein